MKLEEKSTEQLKKDLKTTETTNGILIGMLLVLVVAVIGGLLFIENNKTFIALLPVPIALGAIVPMNLSNIKKLKAEIDSRKE